MLFVRRDMLLAGLLLVVAVAAGCGSDAGASLEDERRAAYAELSEAVKFFDSRDYAAAEPKLTAALDRNVLNPDSYCDAVAKRAVCWGVAGKYDEALAELDKLGPAADNQAAIYVARSFIFKKQGKAAESRTALAKARTFDRLVKELQ